MQNITTSKLIRVRVKVHSNGKVRYVGYFADGTVAVIRQSINDAYLSVSQIQYPGLPAKPESGFLGHPPSQEFVFSGKLNPALSRGQQNNLVVTVPVSRETSTYVVPAHQRCRLEDM
jgi:hypothetical protein